MTTQAKTLNEKTFNDFTRKVNHAHQIFCVWVHTNNKFLEHQDDWNKMAGTDLYVGEFSRDKGCRYKNFFSVVIPSLQHSWILSLARLFDPAYNPRHKKRNSPRLSLHYILELLDGDEIRRLIRARIGKYEPTIKSIKGLRDNFLAHNDVNFKATIIEAGVEDLFKELEEIISEIKQHKAELQNCNNIDIKYTEDLSFCGVDEIFEAVSKEERQ